ncbi:hypothetical protein SAMN05443665_1015133 [Actinomadura meyerae]|jgi:hypothetical protein|uniref:DUF2255 family protein n=1 Tax=Actinomadura meyerae TaxID=240840 RepID=A0A239JS53_9ACTN|nr:DUF2255 family protein [Actinomadura meyerae]SNT08173.1 hypothetical protein SAMN05443665_1015133 [Actinomadura meyerae]
MSTWSNDDLARLGGADEIQVAPEKSDGTLRSPTTIWIVRTGEEMYVRSVNGRDGHWYQTAENTHRGQIRADGTTVDVAFVDEGDPAVNEQVDAAYMAKYGSTPYAEPMTRPGPRDTTLRLAPR